MIEPDAERIEADLGAPGRHDQRRAHVERRHPAPQVTARIGRLVGDVLHVGRIGIDTVAAQIRPQRGAEVVGALGHQRMERIELGLAPFDAAGLARQEVFPVSGDEARKIVSHGRASRLRHAVSQSCIPGNACQLCGPVVTGLMPSSWRQRATGFSQPSSHFTASSGLQA